MNNLKEKVYLLLTDATNGPADLNLSLSRLLPDLATDLAFPTKSPGSYLLQNGRMSDHILPFRSINPGALWTVESALQNQRLFIQPTIASLLDSPASGLLPVGSEDRYPQSC